MGELPASLPGPERYDGTGASAFICGLFRFFRHSRRQPPMYADERRWNENSDAPGEGSPARGFCCLSLG
jgi:hypothetical protein